MAAADTIKNRVNALACEAVNLFHEIQLPVIDRDAAQGGHRLRSVRGTSAVHLQPDEASQLQ